MSAVLEKVLKEVETEHITVIEIAYVMQEMMCTNYWGEESRIPYGK